MRQVILFDGACNLCNRYVQFVIAHDPDRRYRFASLQSACGASIIARFGLPSNVFQTIVLLDNDQIFTKSTAVLRIASNLRGWYRALVIFGVVPKPLRDAVYLLVSNNRHRVFAGANPCRLPEGATAERFIGEDPLDTWPTEGT